MSYKQASIDGKYIASTPYTVLETDYVLLVDTVTIAAASTINLPNAGSSGQQWVIKDLTGSAATYNITVTTVGGTVNLDGATTFVMNHAYQSVTVVWNEAETNYSVIAEANASSGGGGSSASTTYVDSTPYNVLLTDDYILVDTLTIAGASSVVLPDSPPTDGQTWTIKDWSGNSFRYPITINTVSSLSIIDGQSSYVISNGYGATVYESVSFVWSLSEATYSIVTEVTPIKVILPATSSTGGYIQIGGSPFLHNYSSDQSNTFIGEASGNFTLSTGTSNTGCGQGTLANVSTSMGNTAVGEQACYSISGGTGYNTAIGYTALTASGSDQQNVSIGFQNLLALNGGNYNTSVGSLAGSQLFNGSYNSLLGYTAGNAYNGTEVSNVCINSTGQSGDVNTLRIGSGTGSSTQNLAAAYICGIDGVDLSTANVVVESSDQLGTAVITGGTGITITPGSNTITITNTGAGGGISLIDGDTSFVSSATITLTGGTSGAVFTGNGTNTITESFNFLELPTTTSTNGQIKINSNPVFHTWGTANTWVGTNAGTLTQSTTNSTAVGYQALGSTANADRNTAVGAYALTAATIDQRNTAVGYNALTASNGGFDNTAIGDSALAALTNGGSNVAVGYIALATTMGDVNNTAIGYAALNQLNGAGQNTALGYQCLMNLLYGSNNVGIGINAGNNYVGAESDNIVINSPGVISESNVCRLGAGTGTGNYQLNATYISGINGITVTGTAVLVSSSDQLGIAVSSARFKDNIADMGDASSAIMNLRPVTFTYNVGEDKSVQTGLIAEEVNAIMPSLIVLDKEGLPQTVKYHDLPALLLNELQKLSKRVADLEAQLKG